MTSPPSNHSPDETVHFDAVLQPHRSLSPTGFAVLMGAVATVGFVIGIAFMLAGAWPVFGFCGVEILLFYIFFRLNYRQARSYETVRLTDAALTVRRVAPSGKVKTWRFQPNWLRVTIDDPPAHNSQLMLGSHGRSLVIGAFLTPEERLEVAAALKAALIDWRQPSPA